MTLHPEFLSILNVSELKFTGSGRGKKGGNPAASTPEVRPLKVLKIDLVLAK